MIGKRRSLLHAVDYCQTLKEVGSSRTRSLPLPKEKIAPSGSNRPKPDVRAGRYCLLKNCQSSKSEARGGSTSANMHRFNCHTGLINQPPIGTEKKKNAKRKKKTKRPLCLNKSSESPSSQRLPCTGVPKRGNGQFAQRCL